jgi:hypothetical protein
MKGKGPGIGYIHVVVVPSFRTNSEFLKNLVHCFWSDLCNFPTCIFGFTDLNILALTLKA